MTTSKEWKRDPRSWSVVTETGSPVADVWRHDAIDLIVAAPDLLQACEALLAIPGIEREAPSAVAVARAAVEKAKGAKP